MRFTSVLVAALPFVGSVFAYPFINPASQAAVEAGSKTFSMREINYTGTGALTPNSTQDEVILVLNTVNDAFKTAQSEFQLDSSKRDFHHVIYPWEPETPYNIINGHHHCRDLTDDVSKLLATIVEDLNSLLSPVEGILSQIPIVGPILEDINTALDAIIQGLDKALGGILLCINIAPLLSGRG
ncbi:hypothetical protein AYX13_01753 [Cryptococcus neoformans]|nr:hypothetical protein AYX13_01753 [Cryptococcus neoformans var. grubii]